MAFGGSGSGYRQVHAKGEESMRKYVDGQDKVLMKVVCNKCGRPLKVENGYLTDVVETSGIEKLPDGGAAVPGEDGKLVPVDAKSYVSMNMWGLFSSKSLHMALDQPPLERKEGNITYKLTNN